MGHPVRSWNSNSTGIRFYSNYPNYPNKRFSIEIIRIIRTFGIMVTVLYSPLRLPVHTSLLSSRHNEIPSSRETISIVLVLSESACIRRQITRPDKRFHTIAMYNHNGARIHFLFFPLVSSHLAASIFDSPECNSSHRAAFVIVSRGRERCPHVSTYST